MCVRYQRVRFDFDPLFYSILLCFFPIFQSNFDSTYCSCKYTYVVFNMLDRFVFYFSLFNFMSIYFMLIDCTSFSFISVLFSSRPLYSAKCQMPNFDRKKTHMHISYIVRKMICPKTNPAVVKAITGDAYLDRTSRPLLWHLTFHRQADHLEGYTCTPPRETGHLPASAVVVYQRKHSSNRKKNVIFRQLGSTVNVHKLSRTSTWRGAPLSLSENTSSLVKMRKRDKHY